MKKLRLLALMALIVFTFTACTGQAGNAPAPATESQDDTSVTETEPSQTATPDSGEASANGNNTLIAYFSSAGNIAADEEASGNIGIGNTKTIAELIHGQTGGDLFFIEVANKYSSNYNEAIGEAMQELRENARPELVSHVENFDDYDVIFIGYPIWWQTIPQALLTFFEEYDFSGKIVIPFCTYQDSGIGRSIQDIENALPDSTILEEFAVRQAGVSDADDDVAQWLSDLNLPEATAEIPASSADSGNNETEQVKMETTYEVREGLSGFTLKYEDLPSDYQVTLEFSFESMNKRPPLPSENQTVLNSVPNPEQTEVFYLWEEGNAPSQTSVNPDTTGYDPYDFRPYVTALTVPEGIEVKGAVVLLAGGAFQFRGDYGDTIPTAVQLREYGYRCFVVDYRLRPYSQEEGALDVARAVRFIRKNADAYGIDPNDIAVMGYSAGGIQAGEFFISADGDVNGSYLDPDYVPDSLDEITATASACGMIYSFYGRLSVASLDIPHLKAADLPPTFYCYGTEDPFYRQFEAQVELMDEVGITTNTIVLDDWPHGFGGNGGWVADFAAWLKNTFV